MVYSTRRFVLCRTLCHFVLVFFSPFNLAVTSLGECVCVCVRVCVGGGGWRAGLGAFRTFVRFVLVWICREGLLPVFGHTSLSKRCRTDNAPLNATYDHLIVTHSAFFSHISLSVKLKRRPTTEEPLSLL